MSHQTGIRCNPELLDHFNRHCKSGRERLVKILIVKEELALAGNWPVAGSWEQDYARLVPPAADPDQPAFFLFRLDVSGVLGPTWLLITYVPDTAAVKQKMLYAATRATLKNEFGDAYIVQEYHASALDDISFDSYTKFLKRREEPGPMTDVEREMQSVNIGEEHSRHHAGDAGFRRSHVSGVSFPIDNDARDRLGELRSGMCNYVQLGVDILNEAIKLEGHGSLSVDDLRRTISKDRPAYHIYLFRHTHQQQLQAAFVFLYSMPSQSCKIKERMLYSTCIAPLLDALAKEMDIHIAKRIEIDGPDDVSEAFLLDSLYPPALVVNQRVEKPKGPKGRGPRRLIT